MGKVDGICQNLQLQLADSNPATTKSLQEKKKKAPVDYTFTTSNWK